MTGTAFQTRATKSALALLTFSTIERGFVLDEVMVRRFPGVGVAWVQMLPSLCAIALVFHTLQRIPTHAAAPDPIGVREAAARTQAVRAI
jgi:hypothetical protein